MVLNSLFTILLVLRLLETLLFLDAVEEVDVVIDVTKAGDFDVNVVVGKIDVNVDDVV
jgi:hypothetical protein